MPLRQGLESRIFPNQSPDQPTLAFDSPGNRVGAGVRPSVGLKDATPWRTMSLRAQKEGPRPLKLSLYA